jgi:hypothetical protein
MAMPGRPVLRTIEHADPEVEVIVARRHGTRVAVGVKPVLPAHVLRLIADGRWRPAHG